MFVLAATLQAQDEVPALGNELTSWLEMGAELRTRAEVENLVTGRAKEPNADFFTRARLGFRVTANSWLQFTFQAQDARTLSGPGETVRCYQDNHLDAEYAFVDIGSVKGPWAVRAGRQPLAFGDERLVGADSSWDNRGQEFDGVRVNLKRGGWQWSVFSASPTMVLTRNPDEFMGPERLSGIYSSWSRNKLSFEPYILWDTASDEQSNLVTPGLRLATPLRFGFDAIIEATLQRGSVAGSPVGAWAGYWELGYRAGKTDEAPRVGLSYSYASGDRHPGDGRVGTFNDLHPAGYNEYGFFEPFAWRNIRDLKLGATWAAPNHWQIAAGVHSYWLATLHDGVYVDEGPYVAYNLAADSPRLGSRLLLMAQHPVPLHGTLAFGYSKFWATEYMNDAISRSQSGFVSVAFRL